MRLMYCIVRFASLALFALISPIHAQSINISDFYYRDYLDFGQHKGVFKEGKGGLQITGKDGKTLTIPQIPDFSASSNYGSLTSVGRGFAVTASHVTSPENDPYKTPQEVNTSGPLQRQWGLTSYIFAKEDDGDSVKSSISQQYGYDEKFLRFTKYIVEGQVGMLDFDNNAKKKDSTKTTQDKNIENFRTKLNGLETNSEGNIYIYQAGSGMVTLRGTSNEQKFNTGDNGEMKGGGFGYFRNDNIQYGCYDYQICGNNGMWFYYYPNTDFNNRITSGDSGSGIYAYDKTNDKWVLVGVVSKEWEGQNRAFISAVSQTDFRDYQKNFEQEIKIVKNSGLSLERTGGGPVQLKGNDKAGIFQNNKDIIFRGSGEISIEVKTDIELNKSGYAGGFVFESSTNPTTYKFTNASGENHFFKGSGLDIGENVVVEWALKGVSGDSLHKIGKGELIIKTANTETTGLGTLKIGEGKVTLDTSNKAFDNIYITSGRGELTLTTGKAEALGATKNTARGDLPNVNSYTLSQDTTNNMGFYFGTGGGKLDLGGNSLTLNTIAANDSGATITSATKATLEIQGFGYDSKGSKTTTKENTIIHANIGESNATNGTNIDIIHNSDTKNDSAHLIFDGNINTSGSLSADKTNIALQGHATTHATISNETIRNQVANAENGTQKGMPNYMDLSKPSHLEQPDWDNRSFKLGGIDLKGANLTLGRNATLESNITLDSTSKVEFGGSVTHFIDNKDGKNITGSGFSYQQFVESGTIGDEQTKIANQTISYKGTITANGGSIQSHIWDFNASLDLKDSANLSADYLTLTSTDSVALETNASATIQNLKLKSVNDSNLNTIFTNSGGKLEVKKSLWFDNSTLNLSSLDSAHLTKPTNYDIVAFNGSQISGDNFTFQNIALLQGSDSTQNTTKLTLTNALKADSVENATIILSGKSEIVAPKIEFSGVKSGILALDSEAKLTGANGNANVEVSGENSTLKIGMLGDKSFNLNAQNGSTITLGLLESGDKSQTPNANFSGKITAKDSSVVATALESITASVDLSGNAKLNAVDIVLQNSHNSIKLSDTATLTAQTITAKNLTNLTLNATNSANVNIKSFIFENSTTNLMGNLIGKNIELKSSTLKTTSDLTISHSATLTLDDKSKLEIANLKVENANLTLNFADSATSTANLTKIDLSNNANLTINSWDFGNKTQFSSNDNSRVNFENATYTQNSTSKTISVDSTISQMLTLDKVGNDSSKGDLRFETLKFENKNLTFGENSKVQVKLDSSIKKGESSITLGTYYTLISAGSIFDNRADSRIDFIFDDSIAENQKLFVVSKYDNEKKNLLIKFLESAPNTFSELDKQISHASSRYSEILKALTEARPNDEAIDIATRTDDYQVLDERIKGIDGDLATIAQGNKTRLTQNLLFSNDYTINTRIIQVRLARVWRRGKARQCFAM